MMARRKPRSSVAEQMRLTKNEKRASARRRYRKLKEEGKVIDLRKKKGK